MSEQKIQIQSIINLSDYNTLRNYYMYKRNPERTRILVFILLLSFALLIISETAFAFPFSRILGVAGIFTIAAAYLWISHDARKLEKGFKGILSQKQSLTLSNEGITAEWTGKESRAEYKWADIISAVENDSHFFLFFDQLYVIIIQKLELSEFKVKQIHALIQSKTELISDLSGWKPRGL